MKLRPYFNNIGGKPVPTVGVQVELPLMDAEFAIVRPTNSLGGKLTGWNVIHVRSGLLITLRSERTQALAVKLALARIEARIARDGLAKVQKKLKTKKVAAIVKALKELA